MTYEQALAYIHSLPRFSDLAAMRRLTGLLRDPQNRFATVHVAGTNGKGSTAALTAEMLHAAGYRTGLTISPYILDFCERIQCDGQMIPRDALAALVEELRPLAESVGGVGEFAFLTALAFVWFERQGCEICVVEVGLGGRLDATNVIARPLVNVITRIGLDHTELLGDTLDAIAREKCGILRPGVPVVTCPGQEPDAHAAILEAVCMNETGLFQPSRTAAQDLTMTLTGSTFTYDGTPITLPLAGAHQVDNALTALTVAQVLREQCGYSRLTPAACARGIAQTRVPARFELLETHPPLLLDGAHNPQGVAALAQGLSLLEGRPVTAVIGMLADKDSAGALAQIVPCLRRAICVTPENPRALDAHALAARADALGLPASAAHTLDEALTLARAVAAAEDGAVVVFGSLYLASQARAILGGLA